MFCGVLFGLLFIAMGIYMIVTGKGWRILTKSHSDVKGGEAKGEGILAIIIGVVILAIFVFVR